MKSLDIQSEEYRVYIYRDGSSLRIDNPIELFITESGSHRIIAEDGLTYRPTPGFYGIAWKAREGEPAFIA